MKLGFYLADIKQSDGGIFQYSIYLLKMLLKCEEIENITIFLNKNQKKDIIPLVDGKATNIVICNKSRYKAILRRISEFWFTRFYMREKPQPLFMKLHVLFNPDRRFFNRFKLDVLHVPKQHSPVYRLKYPVVISMHDVQHLHFPQFFTPLQRIHKSIRYHISIQEADGIIVSFPHVKNDIIKYFCDAKVKVKVCPVPLNEDWISGEATPEDVIRSKFSLKEPFILTPAATWEHKNHGAVLEALRILKKQGHTVYWIATGHKTSYFSTIARKIEEYGLSEEVTFTGVVSDSDLRALYALASLVIIPTKYEAGSGPLFEAIRYNVPVICSNVTSLPDTIGNKEFVFDPDNYGMIAKLIMKGISDQDFIEKNKKNSMQRLQYFREMEYSAIFMEAYKWAIESYSLNTTYL